MDTEYFCLKCHSSFNLLDSYRVPNYDYEFADCCPTCKSTQIIGRNQISTEFINWIQR